MAISKIILDGVIQMDVTQDSVVSETLLNGETATQADGIHIVGSMSGGSSDIDDTAGAGVTNKTWSADKLVRELAAKQDAVSIDTTAGWSSKTTYIPERGEFVVYTDHNVVNGITYPGLKIGDGLAYVVDLPFISGDIMAVLQSHINDTTSHITSAERTKWNNKLNCDVVSESLILNRE